MLFLYVTPFSSFSFFFFARFRFLHPSAVVHPKDICALLLFFVRNLIRAILKIDDLYTM